MFYSANNPMTIMPVSQPPPVFPTMFPQIQQSSQQPAVGGYWMYCPAPAGGQQPTPMSADMLKADILLRRSHARESKRALMYKTVLCKQFADAGRCNYGEGCQYAHGEEDRRAPPPRHPKFRTEVCKNFERLGMCPYGSRCHFIHTDELAMESDDGASNPTASPLSLQLPTDLTSSAYSSPTDASGSQPSSEFSSSAEANCFWPSVNSFTTVADTERFMALSNYQYLTN